MESFASDQLNETLEPRPEKPDFLKIICILSFICCGFMFLIYSIGLITLFMSAELIDMVWTKVIESQPQLENMDRFKFFHDLGVSCAYNLIGNILSLIGVIMMWRLNKAGFFIYAFAELAVNFFGMDMNSSSGDGSVSGKIFVIVIDLVFIVMYAVNLKYMNGRKKTDSIIQ